MDNKQKNDESTKVEALSNDVISDDGIATEGGAQAVKKKKINKVVAIILSILVFLLAFMGGYFTNYLVRGKNANLAADIVTIMEKVGYIYDPVTNEPREITEKDVADALVNALLDQYSKYYTAEEYAKIQETSKGNYGGIGVTFYDDADLNVDQVILNSPFDRAGGKTGDLLVSGSINGESEVVFTSVEQSLAFINSVEKEQTITLKYSRDGVERLAQLKKENYVAAYVYYFDDAYEYRFVSENGGNPVGTESVITDSEITDSTVGYIRLNGFEGSAAAQMGAALDFMQSRQKTKLILDLRGNGGGYMDVLCKIASYFIYNDGAKKSAVAISQGKIGSQIFYTDTNRFCDFINSMAVIADDDTASASECLIGAIAYYGDLVGGMGDIVVEENSKDVAKTYGKGIMQTTYQLVSGGAFKLTTAKILWPDAKTCIHGVGVTANLGATVALNGAGLEKALQVIAD